ncbi:MAG: amidase [Armatimonadota bacterium]|nr:amidase [Armatimonadota bacterium]MDR7472328.1 amidase [Armatimonadota bacterium]MDR7506369.1 amidase [Armatimonadota bacterium]MDR7508416.1 amidase [Armatimonadota bacterium]MDR7583073.1 amidase [Armatimonadota bacterium]
MTDSLARMTLADLSRAIRARDVSPVEVTRACLERIQRLDRVLNAFITVTADRALEDARRAEAEILRGHWRGPLHGVPVALKDIFATAGIRTTCGSRILRDWVPAADAAVVRRLAEAGAVLLGKLNMSEFALAGIHPDYGPPRNPWDLSRFTGGSSSGSAAAVAAGLCFASLGTDTGGSIRGPAAHCGIVGLKPTYGAVSRAGVIPLSWSLDHVGPMARTAEDAALLLEAIAGPDPDDPATRIAPAPGSPEATADRVARLRVGVVDAFWDPQDASPDFLDCVRSAVRILESVAAEVRDVRLPRTREVVPAWWTLCLAEAAAYHRTLLRRHLPDYSATVRELLLGGMAIPAWQYVQARRVQRRITRELAAVFAQVDVLVLPTMLREAPPAEAAAASGSWEPLRRRIQPVAPFNLTGLPAVSVPAGRTPAGLPVGVQIVGPHHADRTVLAVAAALQPAVPLPPPPIDRDIAPNGGDPP